MMKSAVLSSVLILLFTMSTPAQGLAPTAKADTKPDTRTAQALYEDANGYLGRRYQEFNKQKVLNFPIVTIMPCPIGGEIPFSVWREFGMLSF